MDIGLITTVIWEMFIVCLIIVGCDENILTQKFCTQKFDAKFFQIAVLYIHVELISEKS